MANRRSLEVGLTMTPEKMAFITGSPIPVETPKTNAVTPAEIVSIAEPAESEKRGDEPVEDDKFTRTVEPARSSSRRTRSRTRSGREVADDSIMLGMANLLVPLTTRLQPSTAAALKRAGLEQRLRGAQPATVQEIVEIAVAEWLEQHDFL